MIFAIMLIILFTCFSRNGKTANLLSLGSNDFDLIIDGAVVMVEEVYAAFVARPMKGGKLSLYRAVNFKHTHSLF